MTLTNAENELNKNQHDENIHDKNESFAQQKKAPTQREKRLAMALRQNLSKRKMQQRERLSETTKAD